MCCDACIVSPHIMLLQISQRHAIYPDMPKITKKPTKAPNTRWFVERLADKKLSQRGLARAMGLDAAAVSLMLRGKRQMKLTEAAEIGRLLGRPASEVIAAAGIKLDGAKAVPLMGTVDSSGEIAPVAGKPTQKVPHPGGELPDDLYVLQVRNTGHYMDGWLLYTSPPVRESVEPEAIGRLSMCKLTNGVKYLASPTRGYQRGTWNLEGPCTHIENARLDWAVPVLLIST